LLLFGLAGWVFWPALQDLAERWTIDPQYSHCALVPVAAVLVLWVRRHWRPAESRPAVTGLFLLAAGLGLNNFGELASYGFLQAFGFILVLAGIVAAMNGWRFFRWALPAFFLLCFAIPLPFRVHTALAEPLQRLVASGTAGVMRFLGRPAMSVGQAVVADTYRVEVVDACCGLGMLFVFLFMAAAIAALSRRPLLDKALVFLAAPVAGLAVNILRVSAMLEANLRGYGPETVEMVHDVGGYLMGPAALFLLLMFLAIIGLVFPATRPADEPLQIAFQLGVADQNEHVAPRRRPSASR
jgi:exosortase